MSLHYSSLLAAHCFSEPQAP